LAISTSAFSATSAVKFFYSLGSGAVFLSGSEWVDMNKPKLVAVIGPTGTGKSALALELAQMFGGEIISADSVQVYRGFDIGTAKLSPGERRGVPHHLIDILAPDEDYSAASFRNQADPIIHRLQEKGKAVFVVGGTGLYLKVLSRGLFHGPGGDPHLRHSLRRKAEEEAEGYLHRELEKVDPEAASRLHPHDTFRILRALEVYHHSRKPLSQFQKEHGFRDSPYELLKIGLSDDRQDLYRRIEARVDSMMEKGWLEEVRDLLGRGVSSRVKPMQSLGYKRLISFLAGEMDWARAVHLIKQDTRRYAKRQITWFKADPDIHWFPARAENYPAIRKKVSDFFHHC
jgi:tRNA dimethylallyltransferase